MDKEARGPKIFYGWFVVAACFAATLAIGETFWSFGVFFKPLESDFGWSRSLVSSGYTAFLIGWGISAVVSGRLADRYSPRPILLVAALLTGLGISLCSQVKDIGQLRIFLLIAGLGAGATWSVPTSTVQRWFHQRRRAGLALSIVVAGVGVGAVIFAPLINHLILTYGWRNAFLAVGIIFFVIVSISSVVIRRSPTNATTVPVGQATTLKSLSNDGWTTRKVVTMPPFIGIAFCVFVGVFAGNVLTVHLMPYATDAGISSTASAVALGLWGGFSIPGRILAGFISDRIGWQKVLALSLLGMGLSVLWLLFMESQWMLYCFVFFYGLFHGLRIPSQIGILSRFFGMRSLGELIGITSAMGSLISSFAPYIAGFIFDTTSSYFMVFIIVMVFLVGGSLVAIVVKEPLTRPE